MAALETYNPPFIMGTSLPIAVSAATTAHYFDRVREANAC